MCDVLSDERKKLVRKGRRLTLVHRVSRAASVDLDSNADSGMTERYLTKMIFIFSALLAYLFVFYH